MRVAARAALRVPAAAVGVAEALHVTTLRLAVGDVVQVRAEEEVRRIAARRVVATVQDVECPATLIDTDHTVRCHPREAVRRLRATVEMYGAVAASVARACPRPAPTGAGRGVAVLV